MYIYIYFLLHCSGGHALIYLIISRLLSLKNFVAETNTESIDIIINFLFDYSGGHTTIYLIIFNHFGCYKAIASYRAMLLHSPL